LTKQSTSLHHYYFVLLLRFLHNLLQGKVTTAQVDRCTVYQKKYPNTGVPCTAVRVLDLKVIFEYSFYYTQEKLFLKHTTRASPARVTDKKKSTSPPRI
jgi:hypothetical protein